MIDRTALLPSSGQDHQNNAAHGWAGVNVAIADIQTRFLVKAVGIFKVGAVTPGDKDSLSSGGSDHRTVGEQAAVATRVMKRQQP